MISTGYYVSSGLTLQRYLQSIMTSQPIFSMRQIRAMISYLDPPNKLNYQFKIKFPQGEHNLQQYSKLR